MSYVRVIPRDLFNEAKLLKCLGQLALHVHNGKAGGLMLEHYEAECRFMIDQDESDGSLFCCNVFCRTADGSVVGFASSYNSRSPYPLSYSIEGEAGEVFNEDGSFAAGFMDAISARRTCAPPPVLTRWPVSE